MPQVVKQTGFPVTQVTSPAANTNAVFNVTVASGTNRLMVVFIHLEGDGSGGISVATADFGAAALTFLVRVASTTWGVIEVWYRVAPAVETADLSITLTGGATDIFAIGCYVLNEADQVAPGGIDSSNGTTGTSTTDTATDVGADDLVLAGITLDGTGHNPVPGANQTEQYEVAAGTACEAESSDQDGADGGVMDVTWTTSTSFAHVALRVKAAAAAGVEALPRHRRSSERFAPSSPAHYS